MLFKLNFPILYETIPLFKLIIILLYHIVYLQFCKKCEFLDLPMIGLLAHLAMQTSLMRAFCPLYVVKMEILCAAYPTEKTTLSIFSKNNAVKVIPLVPKVIVSLGKHIFGIAVGTSNIFLLELLF